MAKQSSAMQQLLALMQPEQAQAADNFYPKDQFNAAIADRGNQQQYFDALKGLGQPGASTNPFPPGSMVDAGGQGDPYNKQAINGQLAQIIAEAKKQGATHVRIPSASAAQYLTTGSTRPYGAPGGQVANRGTFFAEGSGRDQWLPQLPTGTEEITEGGQKFYDVPVSGLAPQPPQMAPSEPEPTGAPQPASPIAAAPSGMQAFAGTRSGGHPANSGLLGGLAPIAQNIESNIGEGARGAGDAGGIIIKALGDLLGRGATGFFTGRTLAPRKK